MLRRAVRFCFIIVFGGFIGLALQDASPCRADSPSTETVVSGVTVLIHDPSADAAMLERLARRMIKVESGGSLSIEALEQSISSLKESGLFEKIHVPDPVAIAGGSEFIFKLTPFPLIKEIHVEGEFPLLEKEVIREMDKRVGDPIDVKSLSEIEKQIVRLFKEEGYIDPNVSVEARQDDRDGRVVLSVNIRKGPYFRTHRVTLDGNRSLSVIELWPRVRVQQASHIFGGFSRFVDKDVDRDLKNLLQYYRGRGFTEVEIKPSVTKDPRSRRVDIVFEIREGPRYDLSFSGNAAFSDFTLKKDFPFAKRGNKGDLSLKRGIRTIQERYRRAGFPNTKITVEDETAQENGISVRKLHLRIQEGPRYIVRTLLITGNRAVEDAKIKEKLLTRPAAFGQTGAFSTKTWEEDKSAAGSLYARNGYLETKINDILSNQKDPDTGNEWVDIVLQIQEGPRTLVGAVTFSGLSALTKEKALEALSLKPGGPFRRDGILSDKSALAERIAEKGHPHVTVSEEVTFQADPRVVDIAYAINEGPVVQVGDLFVRGNFRTRRSVVADRVDIRKGHPYSVKALLETTRSISRIQAFDNVGVQVFGAEDPSDEVDVLWNISEKKPYLFEIGGGYDTAREFYLLGRVEDRNFFGINKNVWIEGEYSQINYRGTAGISDPDFFRSGITASLSLFAEKQEKKNQEFGTRSYGSNLDFQKSFSKKFEGGLSFLYEGREQFRRNDEPIPPDEAEQYEPRTFFVVTPTLQYASIDSFVRPKNGYLVRASMDGSKGLDSSLDDFFRYRFEVRGYYNPFRRIIFALRARGGILHPYSPEENVADDQLFYLGGLGDVRGFEENKLRTDASGNAVGGRVEILGNVEVRYELTPNFEASLFYDLGSIRDAEAEEGVDDLRSSVGVGLSYITPVGPISLMYGYKLDRREGESTGRVHFTIGYTF